MTKKKTLSQSLLQSKLNPPISSRTLVPRTRLIQRLQSAKHAKLILLSVPAGFGKTTLVGQWFAHLQKQDIPVAWLTLDEADNDPGRFFTYLIAALQKSIPEFDLAGPEPGLMYTGHSQTGVLLYILDRLAAVTSPFTLILDDFGVVNSPDVLNIVKQLLYHLPPGKRLVIALRQAPEFGLERIRAQGELFEIGIKDLQFTRDETVQFVRQTQGLELDENDIEYLHRLTEGWVAGLQLSTLSSIWRENREENGRPHSWAFGNIYGYLAEEVLARQPEDVQSFLLQTSILKRLTGPLCNALTGRTNGYEMLDYLEKANIFLMPLDAERRWYRYHSVFAKFLQNRLERWEGKRLAALHRAAGVWFASSGEIHEAAWHTMAAGDMELAAVQMERCAFDLVKTGLTATIVEWGERLPAPVLKEHPELQLAYAYALIIRHRFEKLHDVLDELDRPYGGEQTSRTESAVANDLPTIRALALFVQDEIEKCEQVVMKELARLEELKPDLPMRFLPTLFNITAALKLAGGRFEETLEYIWKSARLVGQTTGVMMLFNKVLEQFLGLRQGRLRETLEITHVVLVNMASDPARYSGGGAAVALLQAEALYETNELARAEKLLVQYHAMMPTLLPDMMIIGLRTLARIRLAYGDTTGAVRYLGQLERVGAERGFRRVSATARQERLRIALQQCDPERALQIHREHDDRSIWSSFAGRCMMGNDPETPEITRLRMMIGQGRAKDALEPLKTELKKAKAAGFFRQELLLRILTTKALAVCGERRPALRVLRDALLSAQTEGFIRSFVDEGDPISKMIREIYKLAAPSGMTGHGSLSAEYLARILHTVGEAVPDTAVVAPDPDAPPPDPLTGREIEILEKVAMGFSNEDMADQLCLSVHTVRFHLRNIHWKLGAHNRTQAVAIARGMGLVQ